MSDKKTIKDIFTGISGQLAVMFEGITQYGGPAGKRVGAIANLVNGVVSGTITYATGNPTEEEQRKIGDAIFSGSVAVGAGAVTVFLGEGIAVAMIGAGVLAVVADTLSGPLYDKIWEITEDLAKRYPYGPFMSGPYNPGSTNDDYPDPLAPWTDLFGPNGAGGALTPWKESPIILDLDKDGIETTNISDGAYFDHDKNGFAERTGWASADDGLLVWDKNGDGIINDGNELFNTTMPDGTQVQNGFEVLNALDDNQDGKIDVNDVIFSQLKVWQDIDGDGYSASDELFTLSELGIQSINTGYTESTYVDDNGNEHRQKGM